MRQPEWPVARGSLTVVWHSYYMPIFAGLTCPNASGTNSIMMHQCQDGTAPQYLVVHWAPVSERLHHDSIFCQLPVINWQCRCISRSHRPTAVGHLLSLARQRGTHCQNVYVTARIVLLFLAIFSKHSFSQSTSVSSALEALAMMRYINLRFTLRCQSTGWCCMAKEPYAATIHCHWALPPYGGFRSNSIIGSWGAIHRMVEP